jgi:hypothetical protein
VLQHGAPAPGQEPAHADRGVRGAGEGGTGGRAHPRCGRVPDPLLQGQLGKVTLRYEGKLRHLGIGRAHEGKRVVLLVDDRMVRVHLVHGEVLTELEIDPDRIY